MTVVPLVMAFFLSFTRYDLLSPPRFVGFANYAEVLTDPLFGRVTVNTLVFAVGQVAVGVVVTFLVAMLFNQRLVANSLMRTTVYLPQAMSYVTVALLWSFLYDPFNGPLNAVIQYGWSTGQFPD